MNKLFTKIAGLVLGAVMAVGVGVAVASNREAAPVHAADSLAYTITFKDSGNSSDGTAAKTALADLVSSGNSYVSSVSASYVYQGKSGCGLKLGSGSYAGVLTLNLSSTGQVKATKVVFELAAANDTGKTIKLSLNGATSGTGYTTYTTGSTSGSFADKELAWDGSTTLTSIKVDTTAKKFRTYLKSIKVYTAGSTSTPLTGITLGGAASSNAMSIGSSDLAAKTVTVTLNPTTATDQKVNIAHQSGTSGLFTVSSSATCTSGSGSFTVTGKGNTSGTETFRISGNTETSVYVDLVVTALDDSVTYWTVSFDSDGGASVTDMSVEDGDTFEFPSPGTKEHYSFDGWSSDGGNTLYDAGDESPAVGDDIEYTAYWTQDAQTTVIYKSGDGTGSDISSTEYAGSYSLASFPGTWTAPSGKAFSKWSDGTSQYSAGANYTLVGNTTVTFTAVYKDVDEYTLFSGSLEEGDYVICAGTKAMKNETTSSPRIDVADVTVTNNKIVDPDASIIWHIAQDGDYWTIYNAAVGKYAAFTGTNGRGTLIADVTDYARFTTSGSYEFINVEKSDKYLRYNPTYGFASYSTSTGVTLTLYKAPSNKLSSIALSGDYKTSFNSGETFSFGGTVTASYTIDTDKTVTGSTTFHLDSADGTSMSGITMTHAAHDGHTIYAKYTEGDITKTATYEISVANAPVSSVTIETHTAEVGFKEDYSISGITPTVLPADAVKTTEWVVSANTVSNDYTWNGTKLTSGETEGTITLRCRSTADSSKYDELVVTVTGDATAVFDKASTSGYVGKSEVIYFTYGNMPDTDLIAIESGNTSYVTVADDMLADEGEGLVTINFVAAGSTTVTISYDGGSTLASLTVTVSADSVVSVSWNASNFDVFSGETLTTDIDNTWLASYEMASGDEGLLEYGDYTLKLGGSPITLTHTWVAADSNKELWIEYGGVSSSKVSVTVTQSINTVTATSVTDYDYTFESKQFSAAGTVELDGHSWTQAGTGNGYWGYDGTYGKGQQFGSGSNPYSALSLTCSDFDGTVSSVTVYTSGASSIEATVQVSVGGTAYGDAETITSSNTGYTFDLGGKSGSVVISWTQTSSKAIYVKEIVVHASGSSVISNNASHKAAQKAAVAYAQAFNAAMDETENCTKGLDSAWSTCSSAYTSFKSAAAALGETEEAWALNLVKFATAQYSDDSAEACLERMMKTYEICVQKHGKAAFMSDLVTLSPARVNPISTVMEGGNTVAIVVIVSMISLTAVGGYFFLRKRKEI